MTETDLALKGDRTGDTESLQPRTEGSGDLGGDLQVLLDRDGRAEDISPAGVLKTDRLDLLD